MPRGICRTTGLRNGPVVEGITGHYDGAVACRDRALEDVRGRAALKAGFSKISYAAS